MKKKFVSIVLIVLAAFCAVPAVTTAQTAQPSSYIVQAGDNLWTLSGDYLGDPFKWGQILGANPFLNQEGRQFKTPDGHMVVVIKPGEKLVGLSELGVKAEPLPIESLVKPAEATATSVTSVTPQAVSFPWWIVALLLFAGIVLGSAWYYQKRRRNESENHRLRHEADRERELRQDPVTSAPPMVFGGVAANETARLVRTMETAAVNDYVRLNPGVDRQTVRVERIGPIEQGMISGEGMVGYADRARARRIDPPQPGYRARFRFPDGREDLLMSLQGCMNPVFYGEGLSGFTFTARQAVVPAPEPERPAPAPAPHPAMAVRAIRTASQAEGVSTITIGDRVITIERGAHFTVDEATGNVTISGTAFEMVVKRKELEVAKTDETPRATGTDSK